MAAAAAGTSSSAMLDGSVGTSVGLTKSEQSSFVHCTEGSQLVGVQSTVAGVSPTDAAVVDGRNSAVNLIGHGGVDRRKRGRPPRSQAVKPPPPKKQREEDEDVCFICFDGGSLVLCDRRGCPKAYHPACIKRDEAFFRSKAKWNCGWHICSVCQKTSHYLCYTCTYSLCKACTKNADYLCVRGNKGFCSTCMKTIMLIENKDQANKEMVQVDFDDKTSWEYLFKVYWVILKEKLSLTLDELVQAKNPWKESDAVYGKRPLLPYGHYVANDGKGISGKSSEKREACGTNIFDKKGNQFTVEQAVDRSGSEASIASLSTANSSSVNSCETDKLWHYRDPAKRIQGPFSVMQLRKWNTSGLFPPDMRIWTNHEHEDSVLLTNALKGLFHKEFQVHDKTSSQSWEPAGLDSRTSVRWTESATGSGGECGKKEAPRHLHNANYYSNSNTQFTRTSGWLPPSFQQCVESLKANNSCFDKPQLSSSPSSSQREVILALPRQEKGQENDNCHSVAAHGTQNSHKSTSCYAQSNSQNLGPSSGQNQGSFTSNKCSINLDCGSTFASATQSRDSFEQKGKMNFPDLPSPTPETRYGDIEAQAAEKLLLLSSVIPFCGSDIHDLPSPTPISNGEAQGGHADENKESGPSSLPDCEPQVVGGPHLREIADEWGRSSPAAKPSTEEWDSGVVSVSSQKPADTVGDHVATPPSHGDQLTAKPSTDHPGLVSVSSLKPADTPIEFSTLAEESVSDLLAEVDALESQNQNGMGSPTSAMRCSEGMIPGCKTGYFSPMEELSPTHDPVRSDALSSTGDLQLPCQSTVTDETVGASRADAFDPLRRSAGNSSTSSEGETKSADVLFSQGDVGSVIPAPCTTSQTTAFSAMGRSTGFEGMTNGRGAAPGNQNWGGPVQGYANFGYGSSTGAAWGNSHMNRGAPFSGNPMWDSQRRYAGERSGGPRDWALQGGESGFGRGRSSWNNRQQPYGGGGYSRPPPKGQRICKFYESGRCKKGAACDYLHP
ncbi:Zinc finger CCCH domain-containing protein 44 [Capsicum chinense]|nr:Zinc finger CCCH domain-containing protein 44 [Capsicum chinense]